MKRYISFFICFMLLCVYPFSVSAEPLAWEEAYAKVMQQTKLTSDTKFVLADMNFDHTPELIAGNSTSVSLYTFANNSVTKTAQVDNIPIDYFTQLKLMQHTGTYAKDFLGQVATGKRISTYKMYVTDGKPTVKVLATENRDGTGTFQGDGDVSEIVYNSSERISKYLVEYRALPFTLCVATAKEVRKAQHMKAAAENFFARYIFLDSLSDDTTAFTSKERNSIKDTVGKGKFASFEKISLVKNNDLFIQFYVNDEEMSRFTFPYHKQYALISRTETGFSVKTIYQQESELLKENISALVSEENQASNVHISYEQAAGFRGVDDHINYLSSLLSSVKTPNENGKKAISEYIEYAVNRCSRTMLRAKNNTITVNSRSVSFIAEFASSSLAQMEALCKSQNFVLNRNPRALPEVICSGIDYQKPIRMEFEAGLSGKLAGAAGIRLMLSDTHGVYVSAADLATLEKNGYTLHMEITQKEDAFSVVFTDKNNQPIHHIAAPVWFIMPAASEYATVMASFQGGTDNWGGQYDTNNKRIEFSTAYSGDYQIVENDITINDINEFPAETKDAIRFLVSKGIFTLDKNQNFKPQASLTRYDFTTALVKMFYSMQVDATTSFTDIPEDSDFYRYIASAEAQGLTVGYTGNSFDGNKAVSKEQVVALCGKTLAKKKDYSYPEDTKALLQFNDVNNISDWAIPEIAVALQGNLIENEGSFKPDSSLSRSEGATLLYKTFMLLYDVSPVTTVPSLETEVPEDTTQTESSLAENLELRAAMFILGSIVFVFIVYLLIKLIKYRKKKQNVKKE